MEVDLPPAELVRRQAALDRLLAAEGAGHVVHDLPVRSDGRVITLESRPWRLDPFPYVLGDDDFAWLSEAVAERMRAGEAILDDLYGERRLVQERVVDPASLWATPRYRLAAVGAATDPHRLTTYAVDVVRDETGAWHALQDLTDAPAGFGYALLDRSVFMQAVGIGSDGRPRPVEPYLSTLRRALADTSSLDGPRIVVFSGGIDHASYVEHSYLATKLGFNLVEAADLVVRRRRLWLRTLTGLEPVDVLHRRLEDSRLDPMEVNTTGAAGIPGVLLAARSGSLALANAHGTGVLEAPDLAPRWDDAAELLTGSRPRLALRPSVDASGRGVDAVIGATAERVPFHHDGRVEWWPLVVRMHAVATSDGITVLPCANGRVLDPLDDPRIPTPCIAKDVWVMTRTLVPVVTAPAAPQVDLIASVPTRAAESLYWLGRAAERAEVIARTARVVLFDRETGTDPVEVLGEHLLVSLATGVVGSRTAPMEPGAGVEAALELAASRCAVEIGAMLAESASVREFLSGTAGRVLGLLADVRSRLQAGESDVDTFDELLLQLSAFAGLWNESVVRGPAWHFGDFARRYERSVAVLASVAATRWIEGQGHDVRSSLGLLLAAHDSLVAYRRRHRSEVEWGAVLMMLVHDPRNPRSVASSLEKLVRDAAEIGWMDGVEPLDELRREVAAPTLADDVSGRDPIEVLDGFAARLHELAGRLTSDRLTTPPDPTLVAATVLPARFRDDVDGDGGRGRDAADRAAGERIGG